MLSLSELLVQTPEDLYDTQRRRSDGIGEITTRGGYAIFYRLKELNSHLTFFGTYAPTIETVPFL